MRELVRDAIQPALRESLEKYKLTGFKFERIILGTVVRIPTTLSCENIDIFKYF